MKNRLLFVIMLGSAILAYSEELPKVGIVSTDAPPSVEENIIITITNRIIEQVLNSQKWIVLERSNVEQVIEESLLSG